MLLAVLLLLILVHWVWVLIGRYRDGIPGPIPLPLVGNLHLMVYRRSLYISHMTDLEAQRKYGPVHRMWIGALRPVVMTNTPADLRLMLSTHLNVFDRAWEHQLLFPFLGDGLITARNGKPWKRGRQLLAPAFRHVRLCALYPLVEATAMRAVETLRLQCDKKREVDVEPLFLRTAFDIICNIALGRDYGAVRSTTLVPELEAYNAILKWCHWTFFCPLRYWNYIQTPGMRHFRQHVALLRRALDREIVHVTSIMTDASADPSRHSILAHMLQARETLVGEHTMSDQEWQEYLKDQLVTLLFAGHDTTANLLCFVMFHLARYPAWLARVRTEVNAAWSDDVTARFEGLKNCDTLTAVIKETLRTHPSAPLRGRLLTESVRTAKTASGGDHPIAAGTVVGFSAYALHHDARVWPDPDRWEPRRWLGEEASEADTKVRSRKRPVASMGPQVADRKDRAFAYVPFGAGPRRCVGEHLAMLEVRTVVALLLRHFDIALAPGQTDDSIVSLTMVPANGMRLVVCPIARDG